VNEGHLDYVCRLVRERSGIVLDHSKAYLIEARLTRLIRNAGLPDVESFLEELTETEDPERTRHMVEALTTNETSFFRDRPVYEALERVILPQLIERRRGQRRLRIWSGACSTGQEPVSLALMLHDAFPSVADWDVEILATDLNRSVLAKARSGTFTSLEVSRGLPRRLFDAYFTPRGRDWEISERVRRLIRFEVMNLVTPWPASMPDFDLVLLRNVLIYFDHRTKKRIFDRVTRVQKPDGWLLLGSAESVHGLDDRFHRVAFPRASAYRLGPSEVAAAPVR
jgi:chemotaxis protein methyltransferase CheR